MSVSSYGFGDKIVTALDRLAKAHEANAKATIIAARIAANTEARTNGVIDSKLPYPTPEDVRLP
jgi:predicted butyrate kinase (DUF1464 family)